jgi:ribonuclease P protein component
MCRLLEGIKTGSFKKNERVSSAKDIRKLFERGNKVSVPGAKMFYSKTPLAGTRFAVTLPRGYGNAVTRNKTKRLCKESFRLQKTQVSGGYDLLFLMYQEKNENFARRFSQIISLCKKAGLVNDEQNA